MFDYYLVIILSIFLICSLFIWCHLLQEPEPYVMSSSDEYPDAPEPSDSSKSARKSIRFEAEVVDEVVTEVWHV